MLTFGPNLDGFHDVSNQMFENLRQRAECCFERRRIEREAVRTLADFEAYRARIRANFLRALGGLPNERAPLQAEITGHIARDGFTIEKLRYCSLPNFTVTAALYKPTSVSITPRPAVLFLCGHPVEGKAYPRYQKLCGALARDGFIALAIDPISQGERLQFLDERTGQQRVAACNDEHTYAGIPFYALGMSIARYFVWDAIRAIDYLQSRTDVDPQRIGVTGDSGGGLQTAFLMTVESRLAAAMPCVFITSYESYVKTGQPQDGEQNLYACFADGPGHDDHITAMAPKPVRLGLAAYDFFPIEGALASYERARKMYGFYGAQANLDYVVAPRVHGYTNFLRKAAVTFFRRALRGEDKPFDGPESEPLPAEQLRVTRTGQLLTSSSGNVTVCDLRREALRNELPPSPRKRVPQALRAELAEALGIGAEWQGECRSRPIYPRIIHDAPVNGYRTEKLFFFSEPDVCVAAVYIHPRDEAQASGIEMLVLDGGTNAIPAERARITNLLEDGKRVFVFNVRGVGAVSARPITTYNNTDYHGSEYRMAIDAMKMKTSTLGLRVFDVLRAVDYLRTRQETRSIGITGVNAGAVWSLYAAALEPEINTITLEELPLSFRTIAASQFYDRSRFNLRTTAWGLLRCADVIDLLPALAPRPVTFVRPLSVAGTPLAMPEIERDFLKPAEAVGLLATGGWRPAFYALAAQ